MLNKKADENSKELANNFEHLSNNFQNIVFMQSRKVLLEQMKKKKLCSEKGYAGVKMLCSFLLFRKIVLLVILHHHTFTYRVYTYAI